MDDVHFLTNRSETTFLKKLIDDLEICSSFDFSVSFIKKAGLVLFLNKLEEALERGASGRILTSTYQNFTDVPSLEIFLKLQQKYPKFECHLDFESFGDSGFHTKGYLFDMGDHKEVLVGSSNITRFALLYNHEWDVSVNIGERKNFKDDIENEFNDLWMKTYPLTNEIIKKYAIHLSYAIEQWDMDYFNPQGEGELKPNLMQRQALKQIQHFRNLGQNKALVVAATGSGKTYLSAFDAKNFGAKKLLFVVHKDMILKDSLLTFQKVFGTNRTYGLYVGDNKDLEKDFVFASNQMLARHIDLFDPEEFDYIVIDEVHHAAASTYKSIINHFKPRFLLGLTATPDRMDGEDVYEMFGNNVPYDLRLREALENDLVVPFHYYGISDNTIDYSDDMTSEGIRQMVMAISSSLHCEFIDQQIQKYKPLETKLKCVGFCKNVSHAKLMAQNMEILGYHTAYLTGENSLGERIKVFNELQDDSNPLNLVFTVDILNEGIDIPSLNMVLFLRPTESSTIFIQQLGRGLRKYEGKKYLTVLDFIANSYRRSVQIAIALGSLTKSGTADKRVIADHVRTNFSELGLPGVEIHIDEKSKEEILKSIEQENFNSLKFLKQDYSNFKEYLKMGPSQYPTHMDFLNAEVSVDLMRFTRKYDSYYEFLTKVGQEVPYFSEEEQRWIRQIYWLLPLVRSEEYSILKYLTENGSVLKEDLHDYCKQQLNFTEAAFESALEILQIKKKTNGSQKFLPFIKLDNGDVSLNFGLDNPDFKAWLMDMLSYGLARYASEYYDCGPGLKLYSSNTGDLSLIGINSNNLFRMTGVHQTGHGYAFFIDLNKDTQKDEWLKYKDRFLSSKVLQWESQTGTTMDNSKGQGLLKSGWAYIFVRKAKKTDGADEPFAYLGKGTLTKPRVSDNPNKALLFDIVLDHEVPESYKYDFGIADVEEKHA